MKALIVIDYTYDFVADDGALTCGEAGQSIESRITELAKSFVHNRDYVIFAVDVHDTEDPHHPEKILFPPHNIRGSSGRSQYGKLGEYYRAAKDKIYWMDKTRFSAFAGTDLDIKLRERSIEEVHLVGVCTDICVLHTAVDAYNKGYRLVIHADAVQSFNPIGHQWALDHFQHTLGAQVMRNTVEDSNAIQ